MQTIIVPDAGPLITLAYADSLNLLLLPGWEVRICDMVLHELTRTQTPTSEAIASWLLSNGFVIETTETYKHYKINDADAERKQRNLGELAAQELMLELSRRMPSTKLIFLFEDAKVAKAGFVLPDQCSKVTTRAFLRYLEQRGLISSSVAIERAANQAGRQFSAMNIDSGLV